MQSSSSFSHSRSGKARPSNILSTRPQPSESLPWPSPSFNLSNRDDVAVSADPARPSTQIKSSPTGGLPPTPLTATYQLTSLSLNGDGKSGNNLKLPSVSNLLAHTPPNSNETRTIPLPPSRDHRGELENSQSRTGYSPEKCAGLPVSTSKTGIFQGTSSEWTGDNASFSRVERRPMAPRTDLNRRQSMPVSPRSFRNMPSSKEVQGLGLDLGEETPRLGSTAEWTLMTPTLANQQHLPGLPGAPQLDSTNNGRFPSMLPSSPIKPPLRNWNTDLRFDNRQFAPRPAAFRSVSDRPGSAAMEREQMVEIEGRMPHEHRTWGLAISTDDGRTFQRGSLLHRADGAVIGPAPAQPFQLAGPPTPTSSSSALAAGDSGTRKARAAASPTVPTSASKRGHNSSSLTPHIHKTRLTPMVVSSSKGKAKLAGNSPDAAEVESPSLKMKSKQRSEQLRIQAEFIASHGHLPNDLPPPTFISSSSPTSPVRDEDFADVQAQVYPRTAPPSISPRKRGLGVRNVNANVLSKESSPWGVFGINTGNDAWQPLGPPALSKVLGKLDLSDNKMSGMERQESSQAKKARKGAPSEPAFIKERSGSPPKMHRYGSEDKENDVFGSAATMAKRPSTPLVPASPTKTASHRRLVNIR